MMPSKIRLATERTSALVNSTLVEVEYAWKPIWCRSCHFLGHSMSQCESQDFQSVVEAESPKDCDKDGFFRDRNVEGSQGLDGSAGDASISFADVLKHGIPLMEVDVSSACGAQQLPFIDTDHLEVLSGSPCYGRNVGSLASGFGVSTLKVCSETEHPNSPVMNCQPGLGNPYHAVTGDLQDGDPSACRSLVRLKRNLEEIRKRFNAYRACPNGDFAFPESRPDSTLIFEELSTPSYDGGGPPSSLSKSKRCNKRCSPPALTLV
ncbi:hypothetical protein Nepgr_016389 [Nepenthes gracilis]|uniref:Uncharacterized protein n=1 Tax=Nepenthes gracilis TaxID=150966 RepID=A0AAD3XRK3_NEPGR|nr:hypothetical protein Nepgr_016389 [Nepenthes gracilis]